MKLFITDYDGTLLTDEINLKINRQKIEELHKSGFIIIISTGRCFDSIKKQLERYQIHYDYLHCADGSIIYDNKNNLIKFYEMENKIIEEILTLKEKTKVHEVQISYPKKYQEIYHINEKIAGINLVIKSDLLNYEFVNEFLDLHRKHPNYNFLFYDHGDFAYLCVKKENIDKAYAIKFMMNLLDVKKDDVYVIGDSFNDLSMIKNYNGASIIGNSEINKISCKCYHQVYEYIDDIQNNLSTTV